MGITGDIKKHIFDLEKSLLTDEVRKDRDKLDRLISDDFIEFGSSGKIYKKTGILELLPKEEFRNHQIFDFDVISSSSSEVSIRYKSIDDNKIQSLRSSIWKKEEESWRIIFHQGTKMKNKATLFIICGMPASGKTTFTEKIIKKHSSIHFSEDEWIKDLINMYDNDEMRDNIAKLHIKIASQLLAKGLNIVMDGGYYSKEERDNLKNIAKNSNANFELHYLKADFSTLNARRIERNKNLEPEFHTTFDNLKKAKSLFQEPTDSEECILHKQS